MLEGFFNGRTYCETPRIHELANEFKAFVILDDAHGFGVLGNQGRGVCDQFGLTNEVDVICSSFSKSLAGSGGFVAADQDAIDYMQSFQTDNFLCWFHLHPVLQGSTPRCKRSRTSGKVVCKLKRIVPFLPT